ncbi:MAG: DUF427 domain-containing protein [Nocardioidaceae bacterium]|nr:DUF427 domain-containing protein [Nocardioidaceae bacterium]
MSLTKGSGPFGATPAGSFNFDPHAPEHVLYVERWPRRVRVVLGGKTVADSTDVRLLHPPARTPTYLFPRAHVLTELFEPSDRRRSDPAMGEGPTGRFRSESGGRWTRPTPSSSRRRRQLRSRGWWPSTGTRWTGCSRRTKKSSFTRATPTPASTCRGVPGTCG